MERAGAVQNQFSIPCEECKIPENYQVDAFRNVLSERWAWLQLQGAFRGGEEYAKTFEENYFTPALTSPIRPCTCFELP
jgi:hypothetical protein